jgi:hypothetical protein
MPLEFGEEQGFSFFDGLASDFHGRTNPRTIERASSCQSIGLE